MWGHWHLVIHGDVAAWLTAVGTLALAGAACWALQQLGEARRDRHIQVLSDFGRRWDDPTLEEAREKQGQYNSNELADAVVEWLKKPTSHPDMFILLRVPNYFEDLAIMVQLAGLDIEPVSKAFGTRALRSWAYWGEAIREMRDKDAPASYVEFQQLVQALEESLAAAGA